MRHGANDIRFTLHRCHRKSAGVNDLESVYIGLTASPGGNSVTMDADMEPIFDAENIEVVINEP